MINIRKLFTAEKGSQNGGSNQNLSLPEPGNLIEQHELEEEGIYAEGVIAASQSMPDLTFASFHDSDDLHGKGNDKEPIIIHWPSEQDPQNIALSETPESKLASQDFMIYHSVENLLPSTKAEMKRALIAKRDTSIKKSTATRSSLEADKIVSAYLAPETTNDTRGSAVNLFHSANVSPNLTPVKKSELKSKSTFHGSRKRRETVKDGGEDQRASDSPAMTVSSSESNLSRLEPPPSSQKKRSLKSRKRSRTLAGSEFVLPKQVHEQTAYSDAENPGSVLGRALPGWRSSSLKGNPVGKSVEAGLSDRFLGRSAGSKGDSAPVRAASPSYVPVSKLNDYIVLASLDLEENEECQALIVDITQLSPKMEVLSSYLKTVDHDITKIAAGKVAVLVPSSRHYSSTQSALSPLEDITRHLCIANGHVAFIRSSWSYSRYMFLTAETLLVMKQKNGNSFRLKKNVPLTDLWLASGFDESPVDAAPNNSLSFLVGWPPATNFLLNFKQPQQKSMWMSMLEKCIQAEKQKESKMEVVIKIFIQDTNCDMTKSMVVTNEENVSQVKLRCLKDLHLNENEMKTFELCLKSKDASTILYGHELPFYIQTRNDKLKKEREFHRTKPVSHHQSDTFDHFVLRPKKLTHRNGDTQHQRRRRNRHRRLTLIGLFSRIGGGGAGGSSVPPQPDVVQSTPRAKLFGRSLGEVCTDDLLPKPIMDLLQRLHIQGPVTPGIFRKSGNHKDFLQLKAQLDAGEECNMEDIGIHVVASALKNWLRDLPDCLLLSNLYCKWIDAVCIQDFEEKRTNFKRLVSTLPSSNLLLLNHLICVLYRIGLHSDSNHMTTGNLAICLGPTILWPEESVDLTSQFGSVELVTRVVQMLIEDAKVVLDENCLQLFEDLGAKVPSDPEVNFESEDSMGSQERLNEKTELGKGVSLESLERDSLYEPLDSQATVSVISQMSVDSGLTVSNPLLYEEPENNPVNVAVRLSPPQIDIQRYAKHQARVKRRVHKKSEPADISKAVTVLESEERPSSSSSKMAGASNVRERINRNRFQAASRVHLDDSSGDNYDSFSEDESFTNVSMSSSGNGTDADGMKGDDLIPKGEIQGNLNEDNTETQEVSLIVDSTNLPETSLDSPSAVTGQVDKANGSSFEWFLGLEQDEHIFQTHKSSQESKVLQLKDDERVIRKPLHLKVQVSPRTVSYECFSHSFPNSDCTSPGPVEQGSIDSVGGGNQFLTPNVKILNQEAIKNSPRESKSIPLSPRLTSIEIVNNKSTQPQRLSRFTSPLSTNVSHNSFNLSLDDKDYETPDRRRTTHEKSVPRRRTDVNVSDVWFMNMSQPPVKPNYHKATVPSNDHEITLRPGSRDEMSQPSSSSRQTSKVRVEVGRGLEEYPQQELGKRLVQGTNQTTKRSEFGRQYKSEFDLTSAEDTWRQVLMESYNDEAMRLKMASIHQTQQKKQSLSNGTTTSSQNTRLQSAVPVQSEGYRQSTNRLHTPSREAAQDLKQIVKKTMQTREMVANGLNERRQSVPVQTREPTGNLIEQRIRDGRSVTIVTINDSKDQYCPQSTFPLTETILPAAAVKQRRSSDWKNRHFTQPVEPVKKNSVYGNYNNSGKENSSCLKESEKNTAQLFPPSLRIPVSFTETRCLPQNADLSHYTDSEHCLTDVGQQVALHHFDLPQYPDVGRQVDPSRQASGQRQAINTQNSDFPGNFYASPPQHKTSQLIDTTSQGRSYAETPRHGLARHAGKSQFESARHFASQSLDVDGTQQSNQPQHVSVTRRISAPQSDIADSQNASTNMETRIESPRADEQLITWSVTELKKRFNAEPSNANVRASPKHPAVRKR